MRGVTREQHAPAAIGHRLTRHVGEARDEARAVHAVIRSVDADERGAEILQGGLIGAVQVRLDQGDAHPSSFRRADATTATQAELRLLLHLDLGVDPARRRIPARELDAGRLAHDAAAPVATDQVVRPQRCAVGQRDVDAVVVLRETRHFALAQDGNTELVDPAGHDALEVALQQRHPVVVAGGEVADVHRHPGERLHLHRRPLGEEAVDDTALVEHLDGARVQTSGARAFEREAGASLDDEDVGPRQRQLRRQHHPRRTAAGDHDFMLSHQRTPPRGISMSGSLRFVGTGPVCRRRF